jgi:hypothetical protein
MNTKYTETLKNKVALEKALASVQKELEAIEIEQEGNKITVETTGTGLLLGFKTDNDQRVEVFLTDAEVGDLVFDLVAKSSDLQTLASPFKREFDSFLKVFTL